ncbi:hypothetical protein MMC18_000436 [Xylographa bjoerkii]|nr:hypothetical protein [Xylographa bjoerkii]
MAYTTDIGLRIPEELIRIIIQQTEDVETLRNWCITARYWKSLHAFSLQKRWTNITINHDNLIASPNEVRLSTEQESHYQYKRSSNNGQRPSRDNLINGTGLINSATKSLLAGMIPATQITELVLNLRFDDDAERTERRYDWDSSGPPGDTLEHSLALLFPSLIRVESTAVDCKVPQELLNAITTINSPQLKTLKIRASPARGYFCSPGRNGLCQKYVLKWEELQRL